MDAYLQAWELAKKTPCDKAALEFIRSGLKAELLEMIHGDVIHYYHTKIDAYGKEEGIDV